jgi:hypothetical protein
VWLPRLCPELLQPAHGTFVARLARDPDRVGECHVGSCEVAPVHVVRSGHVAALGAASLHVGRVGHLQPRGVHQVNPLRVGERHVARHRTGVALPRLADLCLLGGHLFLPVSHV